jgi:hypothetical protein
VRYVGLTHQYVLIDENHEHVLPNIKKLFGFKAVDVIDSKIAKIKT